MAAPQRQARQHMHVQHGCVRAFEARLPGRGHGDAPPTSCNPTPAPLAAPQMLKGALGVALPPGTEVLDTMTLAWARTGGLGPARDKAQVSTARSPA